MPELPDITIYLEALGTRIVGQPLERARIVLSEDGQILVDKSVKFQQEKGEWEKDDAFLKV